MGLQGWLQVTKQLWKAAGHGHCPPPPQPWERVLGFQPGRYMDLAQICPGVGCWEEGGPTHTGTRWPRPSSRTGPLTPKV